MNRTLREAGAAPVESASFFLELAGPTIVTHGTDEQKKRFLRPDVHRRGDLVSAVQRARAGSDFAGLGTKAVSDGDEWLVNGQKVWNTLAHLADRECWSPVPIRSSPSTRA